MCRCSRDSTLHRTNLYSSSLCVAVYNKVIYGRIVVRHRLVLCTTCSQQSHIHTCSDKAALNSEMHCISGHLFSAEMFEHLFTTLVATSSEQGHFAKCRRKSITGSRCSQKCFIYSVRNHHSHIALQQHRHYTRHHQHPHNHHSVHHLPCSSEGHFGIEHNCVMAIHVMQPRTAAEHLTKVLSKLWTSFRSLVSEVNP